MEKQEREYPRFNGATQEERERISQNYNYDDRLTEFMEGLESD